MLRIRYLTVLIALLIPSAATAQLGFVEKLFDKVEDINGYVVLGGDFIGKHELRAPGGLNGLGFEVSFTVASPGCRMLQEHGQGARPGYQSCLPKHDYPTRCSPVACKGQMQIKHGDTTLTLPYDSTPPFHVDTLSSWVLSAALGYSQLSGFRSRLAGVRILGAIEDLPVVSGYAAYNLNPWIAPYFGLRAGLTRLSGFTAIINDTAYQATGSSYIAGLAAGVAVGGDRVQGFLEGGLTYRAFPSLNWGKGAFPASLPKELSVSTVSLVFGIQVSPSD
ncbi:MAG: hypothetical protein AB7I33_00560 [Gemmatimonadales bacterium]